MLRSCFSCMGNSSPHNTALHPVKDLGETDLQKELLLNMTKGQHDLEQVLSELGVAIEGHGMLTSM